MNQELQNVTIMLAISKSSQRLIKEAGHTVQTHQSQHSTTLSLSNNTVIMVIGVMLNGCP